MSLSQMGEDLLTLLQGRELYGMAIAAAFTEATSGDYTPGWATLYTMLHKLERRQLVRSWQDGRRRYYTTTVHGEALLQRIWLRRRRLAHYAEERTRRGTLQQVRAML